LLPLRLCIFVLPFLEDEPFFFFFFLPTRGVLSESFKVESSSRRLASVFGANFELGDIALVPPPLLLFLPLFLP
jgi:hypothetical protein